LVKRFDAYRILRNVQFEIASLIMHHLASSLVY
jgi:hypothetical protein